MIPVALGLVLVDSGRTFSLGREYYYPQGDTARLWDEARLRTWRLGAQLWCPAQGGLRVLGQDLDFDDDGHLDLVLPSNDQRPTWVAWGPDFAERTPLNPGAYPLVWAQGVWVGDVDADGSLDIAVANETYWGPQRSYLYSYAGGRAFYPRDSVSEEWCLCPQALQLADLNGDGWLDLIVSDHQDPRTFQANVDSYVFFGPGPFWGREPDLALPTYGGHLTRVADLNGDGWLDILFSSNRADGHGWNGWLVIYWGGPEGWGVWDTTMLPVNNNWETEVADLNGDGWLDLIAACGKDSVGYYTRDKIFWGPDFSRVSLLPGLASSNASVGDLNLDGWLDILLSNWATGTHGNETLGTYSFVRYGPDYVSGAVDSLWGWGAHGNLIADFNDDGWPDALLGCEMTQWGDVFAETSFVYWGSEEGLGGERAPVESWGFNDGVWLDLGNLYDRAPAFRYLSRVFLLSSPNRLEKVEVFGQFPPGTGYQLWARALSGGGWGAWVPVQELESTPLTGYAFQYRLVLYTDYKRTSLLRVDSVKLSLSSSGVEESGGEWAVAAGAQVLYNLKAKARFRVFDAAGRLRLQGSVGPGPGRLDLSFLPRGRYQVLLGPFKLSLLR